MTHAFDKPYWEQHWQQAGEDGGDAPPNPYLDAEAGDLIPGTALDAGCGRGTEALWLAARGWHVTAVDISGAAFAESAEQAGALPGSVTWIEADLTSWEPAGAFDLVMTHYAHPAMPQLAFYDRIAQWVIPGGTLLLVGHLHDAAHSGDGHHPPAEATVTLEAITARLDPGGWEVVTAEQAHRTVTGGGRTGSLDDVIVRATRRS